MLFLIVLLVTNFLLWLFPFLFYEVVRFLSRLFFRARRRPLVRYRNFAFFSLALSLVWTAVALYGFGLGRFRYEVREVEYADSRVPDAFDGYRIVHISDFHVEGFEGHEAFVDTLVQAVNALHPDLVCFTGDLVSYSHGGLYPYVRSLQQLTSQDGVVAVLGNHDYGVYSHDLTSDEAREADRRELIRMERDSLDWRLLLNENYKIRHGRDSLTLLGVENQACTFPRRVVRGDLSKAMQGSGNGFRILLTHDPSHWDAEVVGKTDIPLTLSGHTHAMQVSLLDWTPARWFFLRSDGAYTEGEQQLYVNIGLGQLMPFRIGAIPEITLITLRKVTK